MVEPNPDQDLHSTYPDSVKQNQNLLGSFGSERLDSQDHTIGRNLSLTSKEDGVKQMWSFQDGAETLVVKMRVPCALGSSIMHESSALGSSVMHESIPPETDLDLTPSDSDSDSDSENNIGGKRGKDAQKRDASVPRLAARPGMDYNYLAGSWRRNGGEENVAVSHDTQVRLHWLNKTSNEVCMHVCYCVCVCVCVCVL